MSFVDYIKKQPQKKQDIIIAGIAGFLVLVIVGIGIFFYNPPYKRTGSNPNSVFGDISLRGMVSDAESNANEFVDPIDQLFIQ